MKLHSGGTAGDISTAPTSITTLKTLLAWEDGSRQVGGLQLVAICREDLLVATAVSGSVVVLTGIFSHHHQSKGTWGEKNMTIVCFISVWVGNVSILFVETGYTERRLGSRSEPVENLGMD